MSNLLKYIDIYSYRYNLLYKGDLSFKTSIGGFISLITILIFISSMSYFARNFLQRLNPRIFMRNSLASYDYFSKIQDVNLLLGFSVDGVDAKDILNNTFFTTTVFFHQKTTDSGTINSKNIKEIDLKNCSLVKGNSTLSMIK